MIRYIFLSIILIYICLCIFVKVKFRFWSIQPVFHIYNIRYWISPPGILQHDLPPKTKYFDLSIDCDTFAHTAAEKKDLLYYLVKNHYLAGDRGARYNPPKSGVLDYFEKHNYDSYITLNFELFPDVNYQDKSHKIRNKLVSVMTSRTLECVLHGNKFNTSYVDFLCVHKAKRKQGVAPRTIYTHYVKSREKGAHPVFLFKREGDVNFMVPLTAYHACAFSLKPWSNPNFNIPNTITCTLITTGNSKLFYHYLDEIKTEFDCFIAPSLSHVEHLIDKGLLYICLVQDRDKPVGCYVFRNPHTTYEGKNSLELIASYYSCDYGDVFLDCFSNAVVLVKQKTPAEVIVIENISSNNKIIGKISRKGHPLWKCPMAYYFYNFAHRPFTSDSVFLLN